MDQASDLLCEQIKDKEGDRLLARCPKEDVYKRQGYDHMEEEEREQMEARQREILNGLSILR